MKTLLLLDMHGTALNTDVPMLGAITEVINNSCRNEEEKFNDYEACLSWLDTAYGMTKQQVLEGNKRKLFEKIDPSNAALLFSAYEKSLEEGLISAIDTNKESIVPRGFESCLAQLSSNESYLGFLSNSSTPFLENVLEKLGVRHYFHDSAIIGSDKAAKDTTGDAIAYAVNAIMETEGENIISKVVFIGDALGDYNCLQGYQAKPSSITSEFMLMALPEREVVNLPDVKILPGFNALQQVMAVRSRSPALMMI